MTKVFALPYALPWWARIVANAVVMVVVCFAAVAGDEHFHTEAPAIMAGYLWGITAAWRFKWLGC
jgi:hypothetical protein